MVSDSPFRIFKLFLIQRINGVMVSVLSSSVVDRGLKTQRGQTKDYEIGICWFSAMHVALRSKIKDWLARNQINVPEWWDMSTHSDISST